ncbi:TPR repeat protein OS=Ureibacillus acetophenoni OX=614649 GN=SAMN05877842_11631 PE=4 SV=1 [Ureibacillus acetophenoni]
MVICFGYKVLRAKGNTEAQYLLANCYIDGEIRWKEKITMKPLSYIKKQLKRAMPNAPRELTLADMYFNGESVEIDEIEAIKNGLTFAAEHNVNEKRMFTLGMIYEQGIGVERR